MAEKANMAVPNNFSLIIDDTFLLLIYDLFRYGYFMNKGLITNNKINLDNDKTKRFLCFQLDSNTDIKKRSC